MTILEHLNTLPDGIKEKAIANYQQQDFANKKAHVRSSGDAVIGAFEWDRTPEGEDYWDCVVEGDFKSAIIFEINQKLSKLTTSAPKQGLTSTQLTEFEDWLKGEIEFDNFHLVQIPHGDRASRQRHKIAISVKTKALDRLAQIKNQTK